MNTFATRFDGSDRARHPQAKVIVSVKLQWHPRCDVLNLLGHEPHGPWVRDTDCIGKHHRVRLRLARHPAVDGANLRERGAEDVGAHEHGFQTLPLRVRDGRVDPVDDGLGVQTEDVLAMERIDRMHDDDGRGSGLHRAIDVVDLGARLGLTSVRNPSSTIRLIASKTPGETIGMPTSIR